MFGAGVLLLFFLLGILAFTWQNQKPVLYENGRFLGTVLESPQKKENSYKSVVTIRSFLGEQKDSLSNTNEKVLVYFERDSIVEKLSPGDIIIFAQTPQNIKNNGNPFEFDYKKYLERKKIYRQVYLPSDKWKTTDLNKSFSLIVLAERTRDKLLTKYTEQNLGEKELEILSALTLGYKRELDPETKRVFSSAGAMHVLAVSGLHVGIIYWILVTFLGFIKRKKAGKFIFIIIALTCLWSYAFITGLSPSVMRATSMFSFIVIGDGLKKRGNIYNSLAASALLLLFINPNNLFEVGFQLSYSAVFGIVYLQPKLNKLILVKNRLLNYFWALLTVSIAAQIATFPISIFYFNQFPTYFFITNLFVIPAVFILIPLGILLILVSSVPFVSSIFSFVVSSIVSGVYFLLEGIENLPFAVHKISINEAELIFIVAFLLFVLLLLKTFRVEYIKMALVAFLFLLCTSLVKKIRLNNTSKIIVYNSSDNLIVHLIKGKNNYVVSGKKIMNEDYEKSFIDNTTTKLGLDSPLYFTLNESTQDKNFLLKNGILFFSGKFIQTNKKPGNFPEQFTPDFLINPELSTISEPMLNQTSVILTNKVFNPRNESLSGQIFNVIIQGAYQKKW